MSAAAARNGDVSEHCAFRSDHDVVLAAVAQDSAALFCASAALRGDKEVVFTAVAHDGGALFFASAALRGDKEVVRAAVRTHGGALQDDLGSKKATHCAMPAR